MNDAEFKEALSDLFADAAVAISRLIKPAQSLSDLEHTKKEWKSLAIKFMDLEND